MPVEAQASGRPVIAFGKGGARETVIGAHQDEVAIPEQSTGVFFGEQSVDSLVEAMLKFEAAEHHFSPPFIRAHAEQFDKKHFLKKMGSLWRKSWRTIANRVHHGECRRGATVGDREL